MIKTYETKLAELENLKEGDLITIDEGLICKYIKHNKNKVTFKNIKENRTCTAPIEILYKIGGEIVTPQETRSGIWRKMEKTKHKQSPEYNVDDFITKTLLNDDLITEFGQEDFDKIKNNDVTQLFEFIKFGIALPTQKRSLVLEMLKNIISEFKFFIDAEPNKIEEHEIKNLFFNFLLDKNISYTSREARKRVLLGKKPFYIYFNKILTGLSSEKANSYSLNRSIEFIYNLYLQNNKFYPYLLKSVFNNLQFK